MNDAISLQTDRLKVEIWPLGARLNGVWFDDIGSLVDGSATEEDARGAKEYNGAVVGPVANRIAGAHATIDGRACVFEPNERNRTTLHSGTAGVHTQHWTIVDRTEASLTLRLNLPDGQGGFPGNRTLHTIYALRDTELDVTFEASSDAPTWMNLALHPYWRLSKAGREGTHLYVAANSYLPVDADQIPTGEQASVDGTIFDLRDIKAPSPQIDHNFCLNTASPEPAVAVKGDLGVEMQVHTTAPGMQVYSGRDIGIAIEPQHWPDAMHHAQFPSITLRPGETYQQSSTYRFSRI